MIFSTSGEPFLQETAEKIRGLSLPKVQKIGVCDVPHQLFKDDSQMMIVIWLDNDKHIFITTGLVDHEYWVETEKKCGSVGSYQELIDILWESI